MNKIQEEEYGEKQLQSRDDERKNLRTYVCFLFVVLAFCLLCLFFVVFVVVVNIHTNTIVGLAVWPQKLFCFSDSVERRTRFLA